MANDQWSIQTSSNITLPETNIAPENQWLEDENPFGTTYFQNRLWFQPISTILLKFPQIGVNIKIYIETTI